jgi:hypothetical protein
MAETTRHWRDRATWGPILQGITTGITRPFSRSLSINRLQTSPVRTQGFLPFNTHNRHGYPRGRKVLSDKGRSFCLSELPRTKPSPPKQGQLPSGPLTPRKRRCESSIIPHRMIRPGGLGPSALGPSVMITTCGPIGAASPSKKGLATKPERILPKQEPHDPG